MNIYRLTLITLSLTLFVACGGGGGGGGSAAAPTIPTDDDEIVNPLASLANVNVVADSSSPTIQAVERITDMTGAGIFVSDAYRSENLNKIEITCPTTTTCVIPFFELSPYTLPFDISNPQPSLFLVDEDNVTGITSRVTEGIMLDGDSVTLARGNLTAMLGSNELEFRTFAGWIDESIFFGTTQIQVGETNPEYRFVNHIVGAPSGSNPGATGTETSATWEGSAVATVKADRTFILGDATITVPFFSSGIISVDIMLDNWRNLDNQAVSNVNVPLMVGIGMDGTFERESTNTFEVHGQFYGTGHEEVGGWFNTPEVTGAFGAVRE